MSGIESEHISRLIRGFLGAALDRKIIDGSEPF
ncbi:hypothetical protein QFZ50_001134 [Arthrobacter agilis]|nr:hypothetical protein [Arthrobacter agilis]